MNSWSSKKPSLVAARACVFIFQAFQLFSSSVQFCGRSRSPCPCRSESHERNICEPVSVSCNLCRSILPCRQVHRVTNIYVLSFCVSSYMFRFLRGVAGEMHLTHIIGTNQSGQLTGTFYSHVVIEHFKLNIGAGNVVVAMSNGVNNSLLLGYCCIGSDMLPRT